MLLEFRKPPSCLAQPSPLHLSSPPVPQDAGMSPPSVHNVPAFSVSFRLKSSIQEKEKDEPSCLRPEDQACLKAPQSQKTAQPREEGPDGGHTQKASQEAGAGGHRDVCPRKNGTFGKE